MVNPANIATAGGSYTVPAAIKKVFIRFLAAMKDADTVAYTDSFSPGKTSKSVNLH